MYIHKPWKTFFAPTIIKYEAPTVNDYQYDVPTVWLDKSTDICYMLVDNTMGAALWISRENASGDGGIWTLYGDNACRVAGNVGVGTIEPGSKLTVAGTFGVGATGIELRVDSSGNVSCGTVNLQTISDVASFTGTVNAEIGFKVGNAAVDGTVLRGDGTKFIGAVLAKGDVGLGNVDNTSDLDKPISDDAQDALDLKADLVDGKVPSSQLPTSVFLELGTDADDAYYGDKGKIAYDHSLLLVGNPHEVTKDDVGLANADNTSDINKPISTAVTQALLTKADLVTGKVPLEQLPSMTYNLVSYNTGSSFPWPGSSDTYYVALDTMYVYLWGGEGVGYVMITGSLTIADNSVTMAKIQDIDTNTVIGRVDSGTGNPKALSATELRTIIGSVGVASDSLWDAAGDLVVGSGTDTASRFPIGTNGQVLSVDTGEALKLKWINPSAATSTTGAITAISCVLPMIIDSEIGPEVEISLRAATTDYSGYMSAAQATKLSGIATGANNYTHPTGDGNLHVPATTGITQGYALINNSPGNAPTWGVPTTHPAVTVSDTASVDLVLSTQLLTANVIPGGVDHDSLLNSIANKHVDHSAISVIAGTGMSGGGTLTESRTLNCTVVGYLAATARADLLSDATLVNGTTDKAPTVNVVFDALALKANLASPTFTGTVNVADITASGTGVGVVTANKVKIPTITTANRLLYYSSTDGILASVIRHSSNSCVGIGIDVGTGYTSQAWLTLAAASTGGASLNLTYGSLEPSSPVVGDLWFKNDGGTPKLLFRKANGVNVDLLAVGGAWQVVGVSSYVPSGSKVAIGVNTAQDALFTTYGAAAAGRLNSAEFKTTSEDGYADVRIYAGATSNANYLSFGRCGASYAPGGNSAFAHGAWIWNYGSGKLSFGTGTTCVERMAIDGSGVITTQTPSGLYHKTYKTQSSSNLSNTSDDSAFSPALTGGTANRTGWMLGIVPQVFYGSIYNTVPAIERSIWYATIHSKVLNTSGVGVSDGSQTSGGVTSQIGLVHEVENKNGHSGDCAAVFHQVYSHGTTASIYSESSTIYYNHLLGGFPGAPGGENDGLGAYYSSVLEGTQQFMNSGVGTRGSKGWWHLLYISDNFFPGGNGYPAGSSGENWAGYDFITAINGVDETTFGVTPKTGFGTTYANTFLRAMGKWHYLFNALNYDSVDSEGNPNVFQLTLDTCGIDLCTNVAYASGAVPAVKLSSATYIDLCGKVPYTGTCKIGSTLVANGGYNYGGIYMTVASAADGTVPVVALGLSDIATYLRIDGALYLLTVSGTSIVATVQT